MLEPGSHVVGGPGGGHCQGGRQGQPFKDEDGYDIYIDDVKTMVIMS